MTYIPDKLRVLVYQRAAGRCEYCLIHNQDTYKQHEVDHIVAEKHGGVTDADNLCLSCFDCNRHKGSDLASLDLDSQQVVLLFHPRRDSWVTNFALEKALIVPQSPQGRATIRLLQFNTPRRLAEREALHVMGQYPR